MEWIFAKSCTFINYADDQTEWFGGMFDQQQQKWQQNQQQYKPNEHSFYSNDKQTENMHHCDHTDNGNHSFVDHFPEIIFLESVWWRAPRNFYAFFLWSKKCGCFAFRQNANSPGAWVIRPYFSTIIFVTFIHPKKCLGATS